MEEILLNNSQKILDIIQYSELYKLLMDCTSKTYKYESLEYNLGFGCKITFEINTDKHTVQV